MNEPIALDSFALVSLFHKEAGWKKIQRILYRLRESSQKAFLRRINWGEFYYVVRRRAGKKKCLESLV